ncbi:Right handed beta helix domain [Trypanosoma melophagium]|uniref:Right handed beta helix domain n=1 Tax=Trypanosoma melophagium TaxID=715481 RepID=UPI00351A4297|nr:Right handed beta helix domain [Trypanosoma melophagium]
MLTDGHVVEERLSAWQKKKVRTIVVNSRSKVSSRRSIAGALAIAKPYDRIELLGGEYFESVSITIPVEIVAAEGEDPCIVSRGTCVTLTQDVEAYFEHVEFISRGKAKIEASLAIQNGKAVFFRCKMNSILLGGFARPRFEHCTVTESYNGYGLQINGSASVDMLNCTIDTHHQACADIDTKGVVNIRDCTLRQPSNGGNVVVVRATNSYTGESTPSENLASRRVTVTKCHIYVTPDVFKPKDREWISDAVSGPPVCVTISRGACPVFSYNELLQGNIGFKFEFAGSASLEGNGIFNQKICGILAIVDDKSYTSESKAQNLRISGGNIIDRCLIGIDVKCLRNNSLSFPEDPQCLLLSQDLPSGRTSFNWLEKLPKGDVESLHVEHSKKESTPVSLNGNLTDLSHLKEQLRSLAKLVCGAYPIYFRGADTGNGHRVSGALNVLGEALQETLDVSALSVNTSEAAVQLLRLRGNKGVDILDTRFSSCGLCAVRFGNDGYGLVEDCDFVACGATAIVVGSGAHPLIVGCKFDQSKGAGIFLDNFANPLIMGNEIMNNAEHGVESRNLSRGIVMGNVIIANNMSGVYLVGGSSTIVAGNVIQQSHTTGISVLGGSKPLIIMNKFVSNRSAQILIGEHSTPIIASNNFVAGPSAGLRFDSCSGGTVINNTMTNNEQGIVVELDADPYIISNKIIDSSRYGVIVGNNGLGTFVSNEIAQSGSCNFVIKEGGSPVVRNNHIHRGQSGGVAVLAEGFGKIEHNFISENAIGNVIVLDRFSDPIFTSNTICSSISGAGIICGRESGGQFINNSIYQNKQSGIYVIGKSNPQFLKNTISSEAVGVIISDGGHGTFRDNDINSCYSSGIIIQLTGDPILQGNLISKCFLSGLLLAEEGRGTVYENDFCENDVGIQLGSTLGTAELEVELSFVGSTNTTLPNNEKNGPSKPRRSIVSRKEIEHRKSCKLAPAEIRQNKIYANSTCGVLLEGGSCGILENNDISANELYGIMADVGYSAKRVEEKIGKPPGHSRWKLSQLTSGGGTAIIRKNRIFQHKRSNIAIINHVENNITIGFNNVYESNIGIYVGNNATISSIEGNSIHDCFDGVYAESGGRGSFTENNIFGCSGVGVYICDRANPEFKKGNIIEKCNISGVLVDAGGRGTFTGITVHHCAVGVIAYTCLPISASMRQEEFVQSEFISSAPVFEECIIEHNALHGILVLTVTSDYLLRYSSDDGSKGYQRADGLVNTPGMSLFPKFRKNTIRQNRHFGICHELYESTEQAETASHETLLKSRPLARMSQSLSPSQSYSLQSLGRISASQQRSNLAHRNSIDESLETSIILKSREDHEERMKRQVSFIDNTISNCSIGVVVGSYCHPFLLQNRIQNNTFFGMLLRSNARAMCFGCEVTDNGIAGLYCAKGSLGSFTSGVIQSNNGFCRPEGNPHDARSFQGLPFTDPAAPPPPSTFTPAETLSGVYAGVSGLLSQYAEVVSCGLRLLCEVVATSSAGLSLATSVFPAVGLDGYDRGWAANGGIGAWVVLGSGTELRGNAVGGHRGAGVLVSRGLRHHHRHATHFHIPPRGGFPNFPAADTLLPRSNNNNNNNNNNNEGEGGEHAPWSLFNTPAIVLRHQQEHYHRKGHAKDTHTTRTPDAVAAASASVSVSVSASSAGVGGSGGVNALHVYQKTPYLCRPASLHGNQISKNEYGVVIQLYNVMKASGLDTLEGSDNTVKESEGQNVSGEKNTSKRRISRQPMSRNPSTITTDSKFRRPSTVPKKKNNAEMKPEPPSTPVPPSKPVYPTPLFIRDREIEYCLNLEENHIFENFSMGILCQHVVETFCGQLVSSKLNLEEAGKEYDDLCVKFTLKREITQPKLLFTLVPQERMIRHARISGNEIYKNSLGQLEVTSRYVAITGDEIRTLINIDTLKQPNASMCSSQALLRIPLFASLTMTAPPGVFLLENNRFRDATKGIHVIGLIGQNSLRLRHNTFVNISDTAIFIEGHLASASIGNGNVFEDNNIAIHLVLPEDSITEEEKNRQQAIGITTRIYSNRFCAPKQHSILIEGGGAPSPLLHENEFTDHIKGSVAFFINGPTVRAQLSKNIFQNNYVPVIISNQAGTERKGGDSVVLEGNRFLRNYIGLLVCGGAAPTILRNVFEENFRTGVEIIEEGTRPNIKNCVFAMNRRLGLDTTVMKNFIYPKEGKLRLNNIPYFEVDIVSENNVSSDESNSNGNILPSGILVSSDGEGLVEHCLFKANDIGVNVTRAFTACMKSSYPGIRFNLCLFAENNIAGVFVRGGDTVTTKSSKVPPPRRLSDIENEMEGIKFENCFFASNVNNPENSGDIISTDSGFAIFKENTLTGCVHGKKDGMALFLNNTFLSSNISDVAVYMHKGTRIRLVSNLIRGYKTAIKTYPGAWGELEKNWILENTRGVVAAPFCHTLFSGNRIMNAKDCGILTYGGVFTDNEVCGSPTGILIQNPSEYIDFNLIPTIERTTFDALISENKVHSCEVDGIFIAGGARIEGNIVFNCKNNMTIICPRSPGNGGSIPTVSKNAIFDGDFGLIIAKGSDSVIRDNDIFDNATIGVWLKAGSGGVMQGNAISSSLKEGALDMEEGSGVKILQNTIKNQFSPSYHKTLPIHREKERQRSAEALLAELHELERKLAELKTRCCNVEMHMRSTLESLEGENVLSEGVASIGYMLMAGAASKALRSSGLSTNVVDLLNVSLTKNFRRLSTEKSISSSVLKASRSVDRRLSQSISSSLEKSYTHVIIHVFDGGKGETASNTDAGKEVENVFTASSLASRGTFRTSVTTNSSSLLASITAGKPDVVVVLMRAGKHALTTEESNALTTLERICSKSSIDSRKGSGAFSKRIPCVFTLLPHEWKTSVCLEQQQEEEGEVQKEKQNRQRKSINEGSGLVDRFTHFAGKNNPIYYTFRVSEALAEMEKKLESSLFASVGFSVDGEGKRMKPRVSRGFSLQNERRRSGTADVSGSLSLTAAADPPS